MRYETPDAFRTALEARLAIQTDHAGEGIGRLRKRVVFERFLARLQESSPGLWILKGALAIEFRIGPRARTTMDADVSGWRNEEEVTTALLGAAARNLSDYFTFRMERVEQDFEAHTIRFRVHAELAGRLFETVSIDVAIGDLELFEPEVRRDSGLLGFAGIPSAGIPVQPVEQQIAEKVHAYTKQYPGGRRSSRSKDLTDLCLIALAESPSLNRLSYALKAVFDHRGTHDLVRELPPPPREWERPHARLAAAVRGIPIDLGEAHQLAASLIDPVLAGDADGFWQPESRSWAKSR